MLSWILTSPGHQYCHIIFSGKGLVYRLLRCQVPLHSHWTTVDQIRVLEHATQVPLHSHWSTVGSNQSAGACHPSPITLTLINSGIKSECWSMPPKSHYTHIDQQWDQIRVLEHATQVPLHSHWSTVGSNQSAGACHPSPITLTLINSGIKSECWSMPPKSHYTHIDQQWDQIRVLEHATQVPLHSHWSTVGSVWSIKSLTLTLINSGIKSECWEMACHPSPITLTLINSGIKSECWSMPPKSHYTHIDQQWDQIRVLEHATQVPLHSHWSTVGSNATQVPLHSHWSTVGSNQSAGACHPSPITLTLINSGIKSECWSMPPKSLTLTLINSGIKSECWSMPPKSPTLTLINSGIKSECWSMPPKSLALTLISSGIKSECWSMPPMSHSLIHRVLLIYSWRSTTLPTADSAISHTFPFGNVHQQVLETRASSEEAAYARCLVDLNWTNMDRIVHQWWGILHTTS